MLLSILAPYLYPSITGNQLHLVHLQVSITLLRQGLDVCETNLPINELVWIMPEK